MAQTILQGANTLPLPPTVVQPAYVVTPPDGSYPTGQTAANKQTNGKTYVGPTSVSPASASSTPVVFNNPAPEPKIHQ